jgi:tetratricopeptide (TPR) repeat protein
MDPSPSAGSAKVSAKPPVMIPVTAEDVQRVRNRRLLKWLAAALIVMLAGWIFYKRINDPRNAREAFDAGMRLVKTTRYDQAILNFNRTVDLQPGFAEAYRMRARAYIAESNQDLAIRDFTRLIELQPNDTQALVERGSARLDKNDYAGVIADADRAIALDPKLARAYNLRGTARRSAGDLHAAVEDFSKAVELDPSLDNYFQRASTYQRLGEHAKAIADFGKALEQDPEQPHIYYARAASRAAVGDADGAKADTARGQKIDQF